MQTNITDTRNGLSLWKRIAIRAAVGGIACGIVLVTGAAIVLYIANRPKRWNDRAIRVVHSEAHPFTKLGRNLEQESSGVAFDVDLQNATSEDISIPDGLSIMSQTKGTQALKTTFLKLGRTYFIPARHTVSVSLDSSDLCAANLDPHECYDSYFKDADALVIFDDRARLKITIPMPKLVYDPAQRHLRVGGREITVQ